MTDLNQTRPRWKPYWGLVLLFLLCSGIISGKAAAADPEQILKDIQKHYSTLVTLTADYSRVTTTPAMEGVFQSSSKQTASGVLWYRQPAKLILDQSSPRTEKLITDGTTVWWYIPAEKKVHRYAKVDVYGELKPLLDFLAGLGKLEGRYAVKLTPAGEAPNLTHRLDLTRLHEGAGPTGITVWCSPQDFTLAGFRLTSLTGETTLFNLSNVKMNPSLDERAFVFATPPDAEVVDEEKGTL